MNEISHRDAAALGLTAIGARLFFTVMIDLPELKNAGWITVLAACALSLPLALCLDLSVSAWKRLPEKGICHAAKRAYLVLVCLFSLYDSGCLMRLFTLAAQHTVLQDVQSPLLLPMLAAAALLCAIGGPQPVGSMASVSLWSLGGIMLLIIGVQFRQLNIRWLSPVLGPGRDVLFRPGGYLAGIMTSILPLWIMRSRDEKHKAARSAPALVGYIAFIAAALIALNGMLAPMLMDIPDTRFFQLDRLLSNGRIAVSLQFVMLIASHIGMMISLLFSVVSTAVTLHLAVPRLKYRPALLISVLLSLTVPLCSLGGREMIRRINLIRWPVLTIPVILLAVFERLSVQKKAD